MPVNSALDVWQYGNGAIVLEHRVNTACDGPGTVIDIDCAQGQGMIVSMDSTSNDSNGIEVFHHGLGCGVYSEIDNSNSNKHAIYGKVVNGTGKAGYFEGELETTKRVTARGLSAYYEVNDITKYNVPCNDLSNGDLFVVEDTNSGGFYVAVKTADKAGKAIKMTVDLTLKNP